MSKIDSALYLEEKGEKRGKILDNRLEIKYTGELVHPRFNSRGSSSVIVVHKRVMHSTVRL